MSIDSMGGSLSSLYQSYVSSQDSQSQGTPAMDRQTFGAEVVSKTLDYANSSSSGGANADYDFQKSVLGAYASGIGALADYTV